MRAIDFEGSNAKIAGTKKVYLTVNTNGQKEYQPSLLHIDHPNTVK